jgi:hypothetical protein
MLVLIFMHVIRFIYLFITRHTSNLHLADHLPKGVYYSGIKIFSSLPWDITTCIDKSETYKKVVKKFYTQTPFTH